MRSRLCTLGLGALLLSTAGLTPRLVAQAADRLSGTWKLNVGKSKYSPADLAAKSGTTKFTITNGTIAAVIDGVDAQGRITHVEYSTPLGGKDAPWKGTIAGAPNPDQDAIAWRRLDEYKYESTNKLKGKVLTRARVVISHDGKSRTVTITGKTAQGRVVKHSLMYEKQ